jgi:DNA-binding NarL/FixJ family response regulator
VIRVLVADDHAGFRRGLTTLLRVLPDVEVVAEAASGDEAVVRALASQPDVVLMDLDMPGGGLAATTRLAQEAPHVAVLVLTMSTEDGAVLAALRAGARGYLVKGSPRAEMERALRTVADGGVVVGAAVAHRLAAVVAPPDEEPWSELASLSGRERDVLDLMAAGLDNAAIARRLVLSPKTVRNVVSGVFTKLRTSDRVEVVLRAREAGLGRQGPGTSGRESLGTGTPAGPR